VIIVSFPILVVTSAILYRRSEYHVGDGPRGSGLTSKHTWARSSAISAGCRILLRSLLEATSPRRLNRLEGMTDDDGTKKQNHQLDNCTPLTSHNLSV
jgi:hypothetical protein